MNQESTIDQNYGQNRERVFKHLERRDWLLIASPMVLWGIFFIVVPVIMLVSDKIRGNPTGLAGFDFGGLMIIAAIILFLILCGGYAVFVFILSLLTRRNTTFRIFLLPVPLLTISLLCFQIFLQYAPHVFMGTEEIHGESTEIPMETEETPVETEETPEVIEELPVAPEETPEETPAESGAVKKFYYSEKDALRFVWKKHIHTKHEKKV